ncbi:MAG: trehalose-6-phosphate synthase, partial [archaeon]
LDEAAVDRAAGEVVYEGHVTSVEAIPMGVPFDTIERTAGIWTEDSFMSLIEGKFDVPSGTQIGVGVDRLDYTKGIEERLRALERVWETYPAWRGEFTYVQIGSESRSKIRAYRQIQERVGEAVERINGRFRTDDWQPIVYTTDRLSQEELYGLFRHSALGIVSPLRDGMNLVAQEYVAAQKDAKGILLLSDQAGTYDEYGEYALSITPTDTEDFARTITRALDMSPVERRIRMRALRESVADNDLDTWMEKNVISGLRKTESGARVASAQWKPSESQS